MNLTSVDWGFVSEEIHELATKINTLAIKEWSKRARQLKELTNK